MWTGHENWNGNGIRNGYGKGEWLRGIGTGIEMKISAHSEQFNGVKVKHKEIKVKGKQKGKS